MSLQVHLIAMTRFTHWWTALLGCLIVQIGCAKQEKPASGVATSAQVEKAESAAEAFESPAASRVVAASNERERLAETMTAVKLKDSRPIETQRLGFVGSKACQECHRHNHATWMASYHRTMTQLATPASALGDFDDVTVEHADRTYHFETIGDALVATLPTSEGDPISVPVVMSTGSHHMQVYWFVTGEQRMTAMLPLVHLNETDEWIPRESAFLQDVVHDASFETGRWNETCSTCHATHRMGRRLASGQWDTHVGEFGISCEACHGPGQSHVDFHKSKTGNDTIVNPATLSKVRSPQVCGQCHSVSDAKEFGAEFEQNGHSYRAGMDLSETHNVWNREAPEFENTRETLGYPDLATLLNETFYPDGMIRVSGREYNGLIESKCYIDGEMTCLSCHQMHQSESDDRPVKEWANDQLSIDALGDGACLQCHATETYASRSHTHHAASSAGSRCYNCHMPHTTYGLLKGIRSHQVGSPDVGKDHEATRPNACNLCHLDKTLVWSADWLQQWYEIDQPEWDADEKEVAASILWLLRGNAAERALGAWSMGWPEAQVASGNDWQLPFLASLLDDDYDAIRLIARRSIRTLPGMKDFELDVVTSSTAQHRQEVSLATFDKWMAGVPPSMDRPELLIRDSAVDLRRIQNLVQRRDNTPMILSE